MKSLKADLEKKQGKKILLCVASLFYLKLLYHIVQELVQRQSDSEAFLSDLAPYLQIKNKIGRVCNLQHGSPLCQGLKITCMLLTCFLYAFLSMVVKLQEVAVSFLQSSGTWARRHFLHEAAWLTHNETTPLQSLLDGQTAAELQQSVEGGCSFRR